jgi:hypothetical protein
MLMVAAIITAHLLEDIRNLAMDEKVETWG